MGSTCSIYHLPCSSRKSLLWWWVNPFADSEWSCRKYLVRRHSRNCSKKGPVQERKRCMEAWWRPRFCPITVTYRCVYKLLLCDRCLRYSFMHKSQKKNRIPSTGPLLFIWTQISLRYFVWLGWVLSSAIPQCRIFQGRSAKSGARKKKENNGQKKRWGGGGGGLSRD